MAAWNDILGEAKAASAVYDVIRRKYIKKLSNLTGRNTILYYSGWLQKPELLNQDGIQFGINDADKNGFMSVIKDMKRERGLDLILHTPGGDMAATESLVDYLRPMFGNDIRAVVPQIAMSGGTIIALACASIVMGKQSSIGPIDPQFGPIAATGLLQEIDKARAEIAGDPTAALFWQPILSQLRPGQITECENAIKWSHLMAKRFLETNMFANDPRMAAKVKAVISALTEKKTTLTHGRHIGLEEAKTIFGDKIIELESDQKLQDAVLTVHHATVITMQSTGAFKLIENQMGRTFAQMAKQHVVVG